MAPLRVAAVQTHHQESVEATLAAARRQLAEARDRGAVLALLPEYFFVPDRDARPAAAPTDHADAVRALLAEASADLDLVVAATVVESRGGVPLNLGVVYDDGKLLAEQMKVHPMPGEEAWGLGAGSAFQTFEAAGLTTGVLVCADVLYPEASRILSLKGAELLLNPVMSPYKEVDPTKDAREALYVARAWDAAAFVIKAGGTAPRHRAAVGRSLIAAPWGVLARAKDEWAPEIIVADLDVDALRAFRREHRGLVARAREAYRDLV